jgi:hypothetical protein
MGVSHIRSLPFQHYIAGYVSASQRLGSKCGVFGLITEDPHLSKPK